MLFDILFKSFKFSVHFEFGETLDYEKTDSNQFQEKYINIPCR